MYCRKCAKNWFLIVLLLSVLLVFSACTNKTIDELSSMDNSKNSKTNNSDYSGNNSRNYESSSNAESTPYSEDDSLNNDLDFINNLNTEEELYKETVSGDNPYGYKVVLDKYFYILCTYNHGDPVYFRNCDLHNLGISILSWEEKLGDIDRLTWKISGIDRYKEGSGVQSKVSGWWKNNPGYPSNTYSDIHVGDVVQVSVDVYNNDKYGCTEYFVFMVLGNIEGLPGGLKDCWYYFGDQSDKCDFDKEFNY